MLAAEPTTIEPPTQQQHANYTANMAREASHEYHPDDDHDHSPYFIWQLEQQLKSWQDEQQVFNERLDREMKTQTREEFCYMGSTPATAGRSPDDLVVTSLKAETSLEACTRLSEAKKQKSIKVTKARAKNMVKTKKMKKISDHFGKQR